MYQASRNVDLSKSETELATNIRKATSIEETAPKRKHVRAAIVYTWDHKNSGSFWNGIKVQPIMADEVQTFKALITVHKFLQEGHPVVRIRIISKIPVIDRICSSAVPLSRSRRPTDRPDG